MRETVTIPKVQIQWVLALMLHNMDQQYLNSWRTLIKIKLNHKLSKSKVSHLRFLLVPFNESIQKLKAKKIQLVFIKCHRLGEVKAFYKMVKILLQRISMAENLHKLGKLLMIFKFLVAITNSKTLLLSGQMSPKRQQREMLLMTKVE